jgi:hypothetical protein
MFKQPRVKAQTVSTQGYYVQQQAGQNYIVQSPAGIISAGPRPAFLASNAPQVVYQPQQTLTPPLQPPLQPKVNQQQVVQAPPGYVQYLAAPEANQRIAISQPRIINTTTLTPPRQIAYRMKVPIPSQVQSNMKVAIPARPQTFPHPNGAVIRSTPLTPRSIAPRSIAPRSIVPRRQVYGLFQ